MSMGNGSLSWESGELKRRVEKRRVMKINQGKCNS
jgi:hypothetical protein